MRCIRNKPATHGGKRIISEGVMLKPGKCTLERGRRGRQDPFCLGPPNTPALLGPTQGKPPRPPPPPPPPACIYIHRQGCRGPQDLPYARPIKWLIRHCLHALLIAIESTPYMGYSVAARACRRVQSRVSG